MLSDQPRTLAYRNAICNSKSYIEDKVCLLFGCASTNNWHLTLLGWNMCEPLWPNGEGTGLLNQGLWVRVPPRVVILFFLLCSSKVVLDLGCGTGILSLFCAKLGNAKKVGTNLVNLTNLAICMMIHNYVR